MTSDLRWVERNHDKPHRCPECHAITDRAYISYGPRTRMTCPEGCNIQWRPHNRLPKKWAHR